MSWKPKLSIQSNSTISTELKKGEWKTLYTELENTELKGGELAELCIRIATILQTKGSLADKSGAMAPILGGLHQWLADPQRAEKEKVVEQYKSVIQQTLLQYSTYANNSAAAGAVAGAASRGGKRSNKKTRRMRRKNRRNTRTVKHNTRH